MRDAARLIDHRTHVLNKTQRTGTTAEQEAAAAALKVAQDRYNELLKPSRPPMIYRLPTAIAEAISLGSHTPIGV